MTSSVVTIPCPIPQYFDKSMPVPQPFAHKSINQSFIKYIRLTKTIYKQVLRLVDILIQLPSNKISIVFWRKGQVVRSDAQVILVSFRRGQVEKQEINGTVYPFCASVAPDF